MELFVDVVHVAAAAGVFQIVVVTDDDEKVDVI